MKLSRLITAGAIASLSLSTLGIAADSANALTLESTGKVFDAVHDGNSKYPSDHAFWLPGLAGGSDFVFRDGEHGSYEIYSDGTDSYFNFTGTVVSEKDSNKVWNFDLWFKDSQFVDDGNSNTGKDKLELKHGLYDTSKPSGNGTINPTEWKHWDIVGFEENCSGAYCSSITGAGSFNDLTLSLTQRPGNGTYTFQSGMGANGKNLNNGLSGWFEWELGGTEAAIADYHENYGSWVDEGYYSDDYFYDRHGNLKEDRRDRRDPVYIENWVKRANLTGIGDINVDLESTPLPPPPPPKPVSVPEPSILLGLAAVGFAWRKQKNGQAKSEAPALG